MEKKTDFKALSNKAKAEYVWDYYKWHIFGVIAGVALIVYLVYHYTTYRDPLLNIIMINCNDPFTVDDSGYSEFLEAYDYDTKEYPISLNASLQFSDEDSSLNYSDNQVLTAMVATGNQDLFFGTGSTFLDYAGSGALVDLSTVLSEDVLEKYSDYIIYSTDDGAVEPYPCAIELTDNEWVQKYNYYDICYFGIFYQNQNLEACTQFAEFLLLYNCD